MTTAHGSHPKRKRLPTRINVTCSGEPSKEAKLAFILAVAKLPAPALVAPVPAARRAKSRKQVTAPVVGEVPTSVKSS